ncbi:hypothetical protein [uncultured Helicobacter sp.]|uniref:hypothetical protein n=1 Tax=uncultured Helicobacter sp. TaxID=175537 RepID=UPI002620DE8D|nr:hypothetical protein [uncultured Helicobacter sp.]
MLKILIYGVWSFGLLVVFSGCFGKMPQMQYYEIGALKSEELESKKDSNFFKHLSWEISVVSKIASKRIAYKNNANSIAYFSKNAWIEPFSVMLNSLAQKIAGNYGIWNVKNSKEHIKINVLDCYFDAQKEQVFVRFLIESNKENIFIEKIEFVESGEFIQIIKSFERALNAGFVEIFTKF